MIYSGIDWRGMALKKSLVQRLRCWSRSRPEFLAQQAAQILVRKDRLGDVATSRDYFHQEPVTAFSVRGEFDKCPRRSLSRWELWPRKAKPARSDTLICPQ